MNRDCISDYSNSISYFEMLQCLQKRNVNFKYSYRPFHGVNCLQKRKVPPEGFVLSMTDLNITYS